MKYYITILFLFFVYQLSHSQTDKVSKKAFAIIDTSQNKKEQAFLLYNWVTSHISYDIKNHLKTKRLTKTTSDVLKTRNGLNLDYVALYDEMCQDVGIESFIVLGYVKGFGHFKGSQFCRANQYWNVIHVDSTWILVDVTWGSGYLMRVGTFWQKIRLYFFNTAYLPTKVIFVRYPDSYYFNPDPTLYSKKHLPIDPKWQLTDRVFDIRAFEKDSINYNGVPYTYKNELDKVIHLPFNWQRFVEGRNALEFNCNNNFDIANGYLFRTAEFDDKNTKIENKNLSLYYDNLLFYKKAKFHIDLYKEMYDAIVIPRINQIKIDKNKISDVKRFTENDLIKNKINSILGSLRYLKNKNLMALVNKEIGITLNLSNYQPNQKKKLDTIKCDSLKLEKAYMKIDSLILLFKNRCDQIDTLYKCIIQKKNKLSTLNEYSLSTKNNFSKQMVLLNSDVYSYNNDVILKRWEDICLSKDSFSFLSRERARLTNEINTIYQSTLFNCLSNTQLKNELHTLNWYVFSCTHDTLLEENLYSANRYLYIKSNKSVLKVLNVFDSIVCKENIFIAQNENANKVLEIEKYLITTGLFFTYIDDLYNYQYKSYLFDKNEIKKVERTASKAILRISQKIENFEDLQKTFNPN